MARYGWLALPVGLAIVLLMLGFLVPTVRWTEIFQTDVTFGNSNLPDRPTASSGAELLRVMLFLSVPLMLVGTFVFHRMGSKATTRIDSDEYAPRELWIMLGLIALGIVFRLPRLGESLWYDEIAAWLDYGLHGPGWIVGTYFDPANHVLHTLLTWCSTTLLGEDAYALRLPALLASLASILSVYGFARLASGQTRIAFFAGLCAAVLPVMVLEGVEARGYSLMIFFASMSCWLLLSAWKDPQPWKWFIYALIAALGVWVHFTTAFICIGHGLWVVWRAVRHRETTLLFNAGTALLLGALLTILLYAPLIPQMLSIRDTFATIEGDEPGLLGPEGWHALLQLGGSWYWWGSILGLTLFTTGLFASRSSKTSGNALLMGLLGLPLLALLVALSGSWMYARFTLFALPGAILAIALGLDFLWRWKRPAGFLGMVMMVVFAATDLTQRPPKQPLRDAVDYVSTMSQPGDRVMAIGLAHRVLDLYTQDMNLHYALRHGANLKGAMGRIEPHWIILYYPNHVSDENYTLIDDQGYVLVNRFRGWVDWNNGDVLIYQRQRAPRE
ncbi:MAG: glycosyltransferase family 39 protein [Planctomycetota bacterium]|nr:glycosyltransferase family 39 protein [Planctomycetota bacterium]